MKKLLLLSLASLLVLGNSIYAYESTISLDNKIDTVAEAIMDIMVKKNEAYGDKVIALLQTYKVKFVTVGNDKNHYIANRLLLQLTAFHKCTIGGWTWLTVVNECEYATQSQCDLRDGEYHECGSACRHEEEDSVCTLQCVPYCALELDYDIPETN